MSCTLEELQKTEYEVLCLFADFCEEHKIEYVLSGGTLLGAIRHNGFIPWDDDVDVHMDIREFRRFVKQIKKNPIKGLHLSWIDTEPQNPYCFAKLRKCGTFVPAVDNETLDMHNGVWIDIFAYSGCSKSKFLFKIQETTYFWYAVLSSYYRNVNSPLNDASDKYLKIYKYLSKMSFKRINRLRKILFGISSSLGSKNSEYVFFNCYTSKKLVKLPRRFFTPVCKHIFVDRELSIQVNYDEALREQYGDYMNPKKYPSHAILDRIEL